MSAAGEGLQLPLLGARCSFSCWAERPGSSYRRPGWPLAARQDGAAAPHSPAGDGSTACPGLSLRSVLPPRGTHPSRPGRAGWDRSPRRSGAGLGWVAQGAHSQHGAATGQLPCASGTGIKPLHPCSGLPRTAL